MIVIAILNTKGGVGKTTLTACLAVRAAKSGKVCVVDLDSQGSYSDWYSRRGAPDNPALFTGEDRASDAVEALMLNTPFDWVFLDGPPGSLLTTNDAVAAATLVVIPVRASGLDLAASQDCVQICKEAGKPFLCVLNSVSSQQADKLSDSARSMLMTYKVPIAKTAVVQRVAYVNAMTTGKAGPEKDPKAAGEIDALWEEIRKAATAAAKAEVSADV